jgi:hypothetical protein
MSIDNLLLSWWSFLVDMFANIDYIDLQVHVRFIIRSQFSRQ